MRLSSLHAIALTALSASVFACSDASDSVAPAASPNTTVPSYKLRGRPARGAGMKTLESRSLGTMMRASSTPGSGIVVTDMATDGVTAAGLANTIAGAGVTVSNITYSGAAVSGGKFTSDPATVGITSGIVLSTGLAKGVVGPNTMTNYGSDQGVAGDPQMSALVSGTETFDATSLEFDFVPDSGKVYVSKYVFSSDEYNEFVGTEFNDVVAIFVNNVNCALVDGQPVSINTINDGYNDGTDVTPPSHPWLYRNNLDPGGNPPGTINTEMDGLTTVLTCVASVNKGVKNHIKIAIADANDAFFDSNVFIGAGSLTTTPPLVAVANYTVVSDCVSGGATVTLDASASLHNVAAITSVQWFTNGTLIGTGNTFTWHVSAGSFPVTLRVTDATGATSETVFTVYVAPAGAPTGTLTVSPTSLSPANHQYVPITVTATTQSGCGGPAPASTVDVVSDQLDDAPGTADGATTADILVVRPTGSPLTSSNTSPVVTFNPATDKLSLRAERDESQTGVPRIYILTLKINGVAVASARVVVPASDNTTCSKKNGKGEKDDRDDQNDTNGGAKNCNNGDRRKNKD
jgi:hypothetical protein